jgi:hypothetical protein
MVASATAKAIAATATVASDDTIVITLTAAITNAIALASAVAATIALTAINTNAAALIATIAAAIAHASNGLSTAIAPHHCLGYHCIHHH